MSGYSRPPTIEDLKSLIRSLNEQGVEYLLIGGFALNAHGYNRATEDIDILVRPDPETGGKVKAALMTLPDHAAKDIDPSWFQEGATIRVADEFVVDVIFNAAGKTYAELKPYAETLDLDGIPVHTLNLRGLLMTKQTIRDKDRVDRLILQKALENPDDTSQ
ncbi:MAG: nucleotidyl transferase AbiEii/AbiGii toxin family protein [Elusimicrobiota bacterium]|jgi:predicted nucleotidyltransferase